MGGGGFDRPRGKVGGRKKERNEIKIQIHVLLNAVIVLDLSANQEELCKYLATNYGSFEYLYQ